MRHYNIQLGAVVFLSIIPTVLAVTPSFSKVRLSLDTGFHYDATVSKNVGLKFDDVHLSNLMLPPETNVDLCQGMGLSTSRSSNGGQHQEAVALLVAPGNCSVQEQVETAAVLKETREPMLSYLIFQGDGTDELLDTIPNPDHRLFNVTVDTMGFLFVTLRSGRSIEETLKRSNETSGESPSPYLFGPGNEDWRLLLAITPDSNAGFQQVETVDAMFSYLIFVAMLFILICVPCSAGFLQWYRGGGHVDITRQGARVSVQVIQPGLLSRAEVLALPEIVFHKKPEPEGWLEEESPKLTRIDSAIAVTQHHSNGSFQDISLREFDEQGDCEAPPLSTDSTATSECSSTTTTTCPICIQDFEEGEKIRLLPLCGHAYHTECILPWLTERHGLCPNCRTPVSRCQAGENGSNVRRAGASCHDSIILPPV